MDIQPCQILHDERTSDCRSFGSNIHPSSQSRKVSIGVMADPKASTRSEALKGDRATDLNTERAISNVGNFIAETSKVEGVTASFNIKQIGGPDAVKHSWIAKSIYQRTLTSEATLQANKASNLLVLPRGQDMADGIECPSGKNSVELYSNQTSVFRSSSYNQKKFDGDTSRQKGRNNGTIERVEEFTFTIGKEVLESDKIKPEDKITGNGTENLRMKLCQILGAASSPKTQHSGSHTRSKGEESLPLEQRLNQKDNRFVRTRENSDTIETDSENPDHTRKRPVTRSRSRKKVPSKKQPGKGKNGPSTIEKENHQEKTIFSVGERWTGKRDAFQNDGSSMSLKKKGQGKNSKIEPHKTCVTEDDTRDKLNGPSTKDKENHQEKTIFSVGEKWTGKRDAFPNDGSSISLKKKGQGKNSRIEPRKICFTEDDTRDKLHQDTSKTGQPLHVGEKLSLEDKMGAFNDCLPNHETICFQTHKINPEKEFHQPPTVNNTDQDEELDPVVQNATKSQDNFQSPTFQLKTPTLSSSPTLSPSPSPTPKTDQKANYVSSPASTERRFYLGGSHYLRNFQSLEPDFCGLSEKKQSSDVEELKFFIPRKDTSFVNEKEEQDDSSDSSSEERNFAGCQEGSRERHTAERNSFMLHPIKRLRKHEGVKFNHSSPASLSSKGTGEMDWTGEASEQTQDGFVRAVELFAMELSKIKSKLKSMTSHKSSEILKSVSKEIDLQLQNVHSQIQTDIGKLTSVSKSKRKRLETKFEDQQKQLRLICDRFKEEVNLHLQDCGRTIEGLEADQIEIKGALEKQRVAHKKLLSQVEESVEIQLNDAQRKIRATQEMARGKLQQLKRVIAMCLKEGVLN